MKKYRVEDLMAKDVMSQSPVTITPEEDLSSVLGKMRRYDVHELPIVERGILIGLVTYSTLVKRRNLPLFTKLENIMVIPPKISENDSLVTIAETMSSSGYRAVPVTSKERLVGIISRTDIVKSISRIEGLRDVKVSTIMTPSPQCIHENDNILRAKSLMRKLDERTIPVVDNNGMLSGVVGIKDLARFLWKPKTKERKGEVTGVKTPIEITVKSVMNTPPITVNPDATVQEIVNLMIKNNISSVMVTENKEIVGIVTQVDLIELLVTLRESERVYVQITGLEEHDPVVYDHMYSLIQKPLKRIGEIIVPKILVIHVVYYHQEGEVSKYSIRARMSTEQRMFYAKTTDWDLLKALDETLDQLERMVKREKDKRIMKRRPKKIS